jgi:hypothetical protein
MLELIHPVEGRCKPFIDTLGSAISGATNMSVAVLHSRALSGFDAPPVEVEVHLAGSLPAFNLVGLPDRSRGKSRSCSCGPPKLAIRFSGAQDHR